MGDNYKKSIDTFDRNAEQYQDKYLEFEFYTQTYGSMFEHLPERGGRVLDLGCGPGSISKYLLERGLNLQVVGVDAAPSMIALARENCPSGDFHVMDVRKVSELEGPFDVIACGFCIPYLNLEDVQKLLKTCLGLLTSNGLFYLSAIEGEHGSTMTLGPDDGDQVVQFYYGFEELQALLVEMGFKVTSAERKRYPTDDPSDVHIEMFFYVTAAQ